MYSWQAKLTALSYYDATKSPTLTVETLGYPSLQTLRNWIAERKTIEKGAFTPSSMIPPRQKQRLEQHLTEEAKLQIVKRFYEGGEKLLHVAREIGCSRQTLYEWRDEFLNKQMIGRHMKASQSNTYPPQAEKPTTDDPSVPLEDMTVEQMKQRLASLELKVDILSEALKIIKKDPGIAMTMSHAEKSRLVDALKNKYPLALLLNEVALSSSTYYHQRKLRAKTDKYASVRLLLHKLFNGVGRRVYGYRRLNKALRDVHHLKLSEKVIRRLMREEGIVVKTKRKLKYSSYQGEVSPAVPNLINRDFHAPKPNQKWLTDISEFSIASGKLYLSVILDCFDGSPVAWRFSQNPNALLANGTLRAAIKKLKPGQHPILHSDRGGHYRWKEWINLTRKYEITRSMSKKGCSPDNAGCESFFGQMKQECFYNYDFRGFSVKALKKYLDDYIYWYTTERIKSTLGYQSPADYRKKLGYSI